MPTGYLDNFYARLGIPRTATQEEVRAAYHAAARKFHPDNNKEQGATEVFLQIQESYETLSNPSQRAIYDDLLPKDTNSPSDVLINAIYSREVVPIINSPQLVYLLLNLTALPDPKTEARITSPPVNVCLVLDTSTSMAGRRLETVKETAIRIIKGMNSQDILSIVSFNDRAEVIIPATRGQNLAMLEARISIINTGGGTEILKGLLAGMNEISRNLTPSYHNHIILITDGRTYGDEEDSLQLADEASEKGVTISCLGIGSQWNDHFLDSLASKTGGSSEFAANSQTIAKFLKTKFGQIKNTYANNVILECETPENVQMRYAFRLSPDTSSISVEEALQLGDIPIGRSLSILMEFYIEKISPEAKDVCLADGALNFTVPSLTIPNVSHKITLNRKVSEDPKPEPPPALLVKAMSRLSLYRMQESARRDLEKGDVSKATQRLKNLATQLLSSGQSELAHTVMLEADELQNTRALSDAAQKRIKYGTRALVLESEQE